MASTTRHLSIARSTRIISISGASLSGACFIRWGSTACLVVAWLKHLLKLFNSKSQKLQNAVSRNLHTPSGVPHLAWCLFQETELPEREASKREHGSEPYPSPTHAGGLFAINRDYFLTLGAYDPGEQFCLWTKPKTIVQSTVRPLGLGGRELWAVLQDLAVWRLNWWVRKWVWELRTQYL